MNRSATRSPGVAHDSLAERDDVAPVLAVHLVDALGDLVVHRDREGGIVYANKVFEDLSGYSQEEVVGRNCRFLQKDDADPLVRARVREGLRDARACSVVLRNYRKDGSLFWNDLSIAPVCDDQGRTTHFVGIVNDITERKRLEDELHHVAAEIHAYTASIVATASSAPMPLQAMAAPWRLKKDRRGTAATGVAGCATTACSSSRACGAIRTA